MGKVFIVKGIVSVKGKVVGDDVYVVIRGRVCRVFLTIVRILVFISRKGGIIGGF